MIHVAQPTLDGNETQYVNEALARGQLSSGPFVERFERAVADFVGVRYAVATSSGTTALHLALAAANIGPGQEVIIPALTFVATANAVRYCGATPVFVDVDPATWVMDVAQAEAAITPRTTAIVPVHLYGAAVDMTALRTLARQRQLVVIEDAAEALGSQWAGEMCGSLGDAGIFSFYGNKLISTGEGGMLTTNSRSLAQLARALRGQGRELYPDWRGTYRHGMPGFNYRLTELQGAVGLAQMENIERRMAERRQLTAWYQHYLPGADWQWMHAEAAAVRWMNALTVADVERTWQALAEAGYETRPVFIPLPFLPMYDEALTGGGSWPVSERVAANGLLLPTHGGVTEADVARMAQVLL